MGCEEEMMPHLNRVLNQHKLISFKSWITKNGNGQLCRTSYFKVFSIFRSCRLALCTRDGQKEPSFAEENERMRIHKRTLCICKSALSHSPQSLVKCGSFWPFLLHALQAEVLWRALRSMRKTELDDEHAMPTPNDIVRMASGAIILDFLTFF